MTDLSLSNQTQQFQELTQKCQEFEDFCKKVEEIYNINLYWRGHQFSLLFFKNLYFDVYKHMLNQNGLLLKLVKLENLPEPIIENYSILCEYAIKNNSLSLKYVDFKDFPQNQIFTKYANLCNLAISRNAYAFEYVNIDFFNQKYKEKIYFDLAKLAVNKDGKVIVFVKQNVFKKKQHNYLELVNIAIKQNKQALFFVNL